MEIDARHRVICVLQGDIPSIRIDRQHRQMPACNGLALGDIPTDDQTDIVAARCQTIHRDTVPKTHLANFQILAIFKEDLPAPARSEGVNEVVPCIGSRAVKVVVGTAGQSQLGNRIVRRANVGSLGDVIAGPGDQLNIPGCGQSGHGKAVRIPVSNCSPACRR